MCVYSYIYKKIRKIYKTLIVYEYVDLVGLGCRMIDKRLKFLPTLVIVTLVISVLSSAFFVGPFVRMGSADPGDVSDSYYNVSLQYDRLQPLS